MTGEVVASGPSSDRTTGGVQWIILASTARSFSPRIMNKPHVSARLKRSSRLRRAGPVLACARSKLARQMANSRVGLSRRFRAMKPSVLTNVTVSLSFVLLAPNKSPTPAVSDAWAAVLRTLIARWLRPHLEESNHAWQRPPVRRAPSFRPSKSLHTWFYLHRGTKPRTSGGSLRKPMSATSCMKSKRGTISRALGRKRTR